jgi:hypothetical protein
MKIDPKFPAGRDADATIDRPRFILPRRGDGGAFSGWGPKLG